MDNSNSYGQFRHGFSKSQLCLHKILQIIASYPSQQQPSSSSIPQIIEFEENKAPPSIDLNSELFPWTEELADVEEESENLSASSTTAAGKSDFVHRDFAEEKSSSEGECDPNAIQAIEKASGKSENDGGVSSAEAAVEGGERKTDCFSLLIEAAETVSCNYKIEEDKRIAQLENDQSEGLEDGEETAVPAVEEVMPAAVVRSKRERSHVLPSRYRDSVIEPLKRRQPRSVRGKFNK